jgi:hypothetical protein
MTSLVFILVTATALAALGQERTMEEIKEDGLVQARKQLRG